MWINHTIALFQLKPFIKWRALLVSWDILCFTALNPHAAFLCLLSMTEPSDYFPAVLTIHLLFLPT